MANWTILKAAIADAIKANGTNAITGDLLQSTLISIVSNVGENATFKGIAIPTTVPGTPDGPVFYLATTPGVYTNFSAIEIGYGLSLITKINNAWISYNLFEGSIEQSRSQNTNTLPSSKLLDDSLVKLDPLRSRYAETLSSFSSDEKQLVKNYILAWIDLVVGSSYDELLNTTNHFGYVSEPIITFKNEVMSLHDNNGNPFIVGNCRVMFFDIHKKAISQIILNTSNIFTVPDNDDIYYVVLEYPSGYGTSTRLHFGDFFIDNNIIKISNRDLAYKYYINPWKGKKIVTYGDSITQYGFWQQTIKKYFEFSEIINYGLSGSKVTNIDPHNWWVNSLTGNVYGSLNAYPSPSPDWENATEVIDNFSSQSRIDCIPTDTDVIIIMGGTNDSGVNPSIGDTTFNVGLGTFNENTLKGAVCETIRKIQIRIPNAVIIFATPLSGLGSYSDNKNYSQNLPINQVAYAIKEACNYMSIPIIDVFSECGINISNSSKYLLADKTHPTYQSGNTQTGYGSSMIARVMISGLKRIEPLNQNEIWIN